MIKSLLYCTISVNSMPDRHPIYPNRIICQPQYSNGCKKKKHIRNQYSIFRFVQNRKYKLEHLQYECIIYFLRKRCVSLRSNRVKCYYADSWYTAYSYLSSSTTHTYFCTILCDLAYRKYCLTNGSKFSVVRAYDADIL